jgi:hypothetical protein
MEQAMIVMMMEGRVVVAIVEFTAMMRTRKNVVEMATEVLQRKGKGSCSGSQVKKHSRKVVLIQHDYFHNERYPLTNTRDGQRPTMLGHKYALSTIFIGYIALKKCGTNQVRGSTSL